MEPHSHTHRPAHDLYATGQPHRAVLRQVIDQRLLSPLIAPLSFPLTQGIYAESIQHSLSIVSRFSRLYGESAEGLQCEKLIHAQIAATDGNFLMTLDPRQCVHTPFDPQSPTVEMRPLGPLGWKIEIGSSPTSPDTFARIGARALKVGERLAYPIMPIPGLEGAAGFDAVAAALALEHSRREIDTLELLSPRELLISRGDQRYTVACSIGFWVSGDFLCSNGHLAFARRTFEVRPEYREQLFIDISGVDNNGAKSAYVNAPSLPLIKMIDTVRQVMHDNFSTRSPSRKKSVLELL